MNRQYQESCQIPLFGAYTSQNSICSPNFRGDCLEKTFYGRDCFTYDCLDLVVSFHLFVFENMLLLCLLVCLLDRSKIVTPVFGTAGTYVR